MFQGAIVGLIVGAAIAVVGYVYAGIRKPPGSIRTKPMKVQTVVSNLPKTEVIRRLQSITSNHYYKIEEGFLSEEFVLFSEKPNAMSWGFYFPVFVSDQNGQTIIEIGTQSKIFQTGPIVTKASNNFLETVNHVLRPY